MKGQDPQGLCSADLLAGSQCCPAQHQGRAKQFNILVQLNLKVFMEQKNVTFFHPKQLYLAPAAVVCRQSVKFKGSSQF